MTRIPTLLGLDFFRKVVELQQPYRDRKETRNSLQSSGLSLDDAWCQFFKAHDFFIGLSLHGPREIHDRYRKDRRGEGTFERAMAGVRLLQKHQVEFNALACVGRETAHRPLEVYRFFRDAGIRYVQFTPIVEREPDAGAQAIKWWLARPAVLDRPEPNTRVTVWSVGPEAYGDFLIAIYEEWVRQDVGALLVMNFEWALTAGFGPHKERTLPRCCRECEVKEACWGGCPKLRFATSPNGEPGLHYLCAGYKKFFRHIRKYLRAMAPLLDNGLPAAYVMQAVMGPLVITRL